MKGLSLSRRLVPAVPVEVAQARASALPGVPGPRTGRLAQRGRGRSIRDVGVLPSSGREPRGRPRLQGPRRVSLSTAGNSRATDGRPVCPIATPCPPAWRPRVSPYSRRTGRSSRMTGVAATRTTHRPGHRNQQDRFREAAGIMQSLMPPNRKDIASDYPMIAGIHSLSSSAIRSRAS